MTGRPDEVDDQVEDTEVGDRERVFAEAPAAFIGGMWFTPDEAAPGGVRPLTETELRAITDRVRASQAEAVADQIEAAERYPETSRGAQPSDGVRADGDVQEWQR